MDMIRWIRDSQARTSLVIAALYGTATLGAALLLRRAGPEAPVLAALIVGAAIVITGWMIRSPRYPRWALVTASLVLALGSTLVAALDRDPAGALLHPVGTLGYGWLYLWIAASSPAGRGSWCASPWALVAGSVLLVAGAWIAQGLS